MVLMPLWGPDGSKSDFTPLQKATDYSMTSFLTTGGIRGHSEKMISKFYPRTHNMGITRQIYEILVVWRITAWTRYRI